MTRRQRKHVPLSVKLEVALRQLGLDPAHVRLDHTPPREMRDRIEHMDGTVTYIPDELDPRYMQWLSTDDHARKTTGAAPGEGKATVANSDIHKIAKVKRLNGTTPKRRKGRAWPKGRKIQSRRGFPKRRK